MSNTSKNIQLLSLEPYRHLFPPCPEVDHTVKKGASVSDTVKFIPEIVKRDSWHAKKYVDQELRGLTTYEACKKLWGFVYYHIKYKKDERGAEQVRSARRLIKDGEGDCDCYTTFIDKCLHQLKIPFINRITKYDSNSFQHIYPIVPIGSGKYIVMDCVVDNFNYEQPYTAKEDYPMDLQYLDGIEDTPAALVGIDARDLFSNTNEIGELGKLLKKKNSGGGGGAPAKKGIFKKKTPEQKQVKKQAKKEKRQVVKKKVLKVVNKVNKVNPATVLLRAGILASMKLNVMKVAESLRWGYATREFAASKGMDMSKYDKLKTVLKKAESVFYAAGGKPENLKKAILTGRGNKNHEVAGMDGLGEYSTVPELLGAIYDDEFVNGLEGFGELGELGEPATAASITAASGAVGALAVLIKAIGSLFQGKGKKKKGADNQAAEEPANDAGSESAPSPEEAPSEPIPEEQTEPASSPGDEPDAEAEPASEDGVENLPANTDENNEVAPADDSGDQAGDEAPQPDEGTSGILAGPSFSIKALWAKHKKWLLPVGIGVGVLAIAGIITYASTSKENKHTQRKFQPSLNGHSSRRKKKKGGHGKYGKKSVMALQ